MSRQRCAGRRGGKAEFPCGLMGRGWAEVLRCRLGVCRGASLSTGSVSRCFAVGWECVEVLRCRLGVCRIVVEFLDGFCVIFSLVYGMVGISYKIFCLYGHSWSFGF